MASREVMQSTILPGMMSGGSSRLSQEVATSRIQGTKMCHTNRLLRRTMQTLTRTLEKQNSGNDVDVQSVRMKIVLRSWTAMTLLCVWQLALKSDIICIKSYVILGCLKIQ